MSPARLVSPPSHPRLSGRCDFDYPARRRCQGLQGGLGGQGYRRLIALLDPDATATADSGGLARARLLPISGAERIARYAVEVAAMAPDLMLLERTVNGKPGLAGQQDGVTVLVVAVDAADERIKHIWAVRNPEKLRSWTMG
jgi:RNA polymerase sigma-70 factor (ECF subfamily)